MMDALEYLKIRNKMIINDKIDGFQIRRIEIDMPEQAVKIIEAEKELKK